ncbi:hypothetical protein PDENDC454_12795 [Paenibacillus dendritiformis C454]|uniref:Uncharacterized protein n=1 Tax=Paenibacillus dendritiformis C454 TaxID=1131935 RepID=H3SGA4_9BACL|nr:hypothetical protein PDENDC454_12795 [Paenibacillus dendritiformis C454]
MLPAAQYLQLFTSHSTSLAIACHPLCNSIDGMRAVLYAWLLQSLRQDMDRQAMSFLASPRKGSEVTLVEGPCEAGILIGPPLQLGIVRGKPCFFCLCTTIPMAQGRRGPIAFLIAIIPTAQALS